MARKGVTGYATLVGPGQMKERDTFTCNHCNSIRMVTPNSNSPYHGVGDLCYGCDQPVCERCAQKLAQGFKCEVFEKVLDRMENRQRFRASL